MLLTDVNISDNTPFYHSDFGHDFQYKGSYNQAHEYKIPGLSVSVQFLEKRARLQNDDGHHHLEVACNKWLQ